MNALILTLFVSAALTVFAVILYVQSIKSKAQEHVHRLAILPLLDDEGAVIVKIKETPAGQNTAVNKNSENVHCQECDKTSKS